MTKLTVAILTGLLALALTAAHVWGKSGHVSAAGTVSGAVTAIHLHSTGTALVLRVSGNRLVDLTVSPHASVRAADGRSMSAADILLGDRLTVARPGFIQDLSQRLITVKGIISVAPLESGDPLVIQQSTSSAILVDINARTRYSDASHETARLDQLEDADQVQVRGLFDSVQGEMTRADSVARLGPYHKKHGGATA